MATFNNLTDPLSKFCGHPFWNVSTAWDTYDPDLGLCLERTVLVWGPCLFLWVCAPAYIMKQRQTSEPAIPSSPLLYFKVVFSLLAAAAAVAELSLVEILSASSYDFVTPLTLILSYASTVLSIAQYILYLFSFSSNCCTVLILSCLQVFLVLFGRRCGERSNGLIWLFWLTMVLCGVPQLKSSLSSTVYNDGPLEMTIAFLVQYIAAVLLLSLNSFADNPPNSHLLNK
ncbi:Multidrug resistance-associated protein 1-like 4, partial [Homarus americanus]